MTDGITALILRPGEYLRRQGASCPSGEYTLLQQADGNAVVIRTWDATPVWASGTARCTDPQQPAARLLLRHDGQLVVLAPGGEELWSTNTSGQPLTRLVLRDNGMLALTEESGAIGWRTPPAPPPQVWDGWRNVTDGRVLRPGQGLRHASLTSPSGNYVLLVDGSGNPRLWERDGGLLWEMYDYPGFGLHLDTDGLLVRRGPDGRKSTYGEPQWPAKPLYGNELRVTDEGDLILTNQAGKPVWSSRTSAAAMAARAARIRTPEPRLCTDSTPLIRTDFSDDEAWALVLHEVIAPQGPDGWEADVEPINVPAFADHSLDRLLELLPLDTPSIALVADEVTFASGEHPVLVVNLDSDDDKRGRTFRAIPRFLAEVVINLSLGNLDWGDFADGLDADGVLRDEV